VEHTIHDFELRCFGNEISGVGVHASPPAKTTTERTESALTKVNSSLPGMAL
jgi:hypothetical protein